MKPGLIRWILPLLVFLASQLLLYFFMQYLHLDYFNKDEWSRWDSGHYEALAQLRFEYVPCNGNWNQIGESWNGCGNAGWLPGYPLLMHLLVKTGMDVRWAGILVSRLFFMGMLLLVSFQMDMRKFSLRNFLVLMLFAFWPGFIYYHAIFPMAQCTFFLLLMVYFVSKERFWWAGVSGAAACFTYSTAFSLCIATFAWAVYTYRRDFPLLFKRILQLSIIPFLGFVAVLVLHHFLFGYWNAFFSVQAKYGHGFNFFGKILLWIVRKLFNEKPDIVLNTWILALALSFFLFWLGWKSWIRRNELQPWQLFAITISLAGWLFLLSMGTNVSYHRTAAIAAPALYVIAQSSKRSLWIALGAFLLMGSQICILFYRSLVY